MKIVFGDFTVAYTVVGEKEEEAAAALEHRLDILDHSRGYGIISSGDYYAEKKDLRTSIAEEYGVEIEMVDSADVKYKVVDGQQIWYMD
ncbi:MAG: hypothetical protein IKL27_06555 [Oscillospiraceae bacterium]|nr:hypothetical protein [Oscillospiraceae bacterium]